MGSGGGARTALGCQPFCGRPAGSACTLTTAATVAHHNASSTILIRATNHNRHTAGAVGPGAVRGAWGRRQHRLGPLLWFISTHTYIYMYIYLCIYANMHTRIHAHLSYIYIHIYTYMCIYIYVSVCVCTNARGMALVCGQGPHRLRPPPQPPWGLGPSAEPLEEIENNADWKLEPLENH